ncbi:hypothetical protein JOE40_000864 [Arthrobacter sp. PvP102]|uniref:WxL protein peptidoglycan domain-containing protein n=1 Tax=unclassified Arthrobacter TaxID=235627 RepID=UPI001B697C84|nr:MULTISPECIES: DUF916 domain-containing protein [unclassified Arthrobacter]MBP1235396.1 hypothetical protein [Arthrobacter sp. PvP103]MBP1236355.1 hypothetical protein [Arthrobacter sp. PvP102]
MKPPSPHQHSHRPLRVIFAMVLLTLGIFIAAEPVSAVDNGTLGIRPETESDFFHLSLYPGAATEATAVVSNHTSSPVTLFTYPVDGENTVQGTFAMAAQSDPRNSVGAWVQLDAEQVSVPANTDLKVPFRLTVPQGTAPGDYAGGLIIQSPTVQGKTTAVNGDTALRLDTIQRQGVRIYLTVAGTAVKSLAHGNLSWKQNRDTLDFILPVRNTGTTILHPSAEMNLSGWPDPATSLKFDAPDGLLPGASIDLHARLAQAPIVQNGTAEATLTSEAGTSQAGTRVLYAPWALLATGLVLLAAALYGAWRAVRFVRRARVALSQVNSNGPGAANEHASPPSPATPSALLGEAKANRRRLQ